MKVFILLSVILSLVLGIQQKSHDVLMADLDVNVEESWKSLEQTRVGKMFIDFAELSMMATGAMESLIEGVKAFGRQIEDRLKMENENFDALLADHTSKVIAYQQLVSQAEFDISKAKKSLNAELIPRSNDLDDILLNLKGKIENEKKSVENEVAIRTSQNENFISLTNDYTQAIRGIDESLELIDTMFREGQVVGSFLEVPSQMRKKISRQFKLIRTNTEKVLMQSLVNFQYGHQFSSFISALNELSDSQNFKDRSVCKEMTDFLNSLRGNIQEALQTAYADEALQKTTHDQRITQLQAERVVFDKQYAEAYQEREDKSVEIANTQVYISNRTLDLSSYEIRLKLEQNAFAANQKIHDDVVSDINEQLAILVKVLHLIESPPFKQFLGNKMNKQ